MSQHSARKFSFTFCDERGQINLMFVEFQILYNRSVNGRKYGTCVISENSLWITHLIPGKETHNR